MATVVEKHPKRITHAKSTAQSSEPASKAADDLLATVSSSQLANALSAGYEDIPFPAAMMQAIGDDLDAVLGQMVSGSDVEPGTVERLVSRCRIAAELASRGAL